MPSPMLPAGLRINFKKTAPNDNRPDYEAPMDANGDNVYEVEVVATDRAGATSKQVTKVIVMPLTGADQ